jgi:hypothetical protein
MIEMRRVGSGEGVIITPLYVDDDLLAHIVLGEHAKRWSEIRPTLEREGMPRIRRAIGGL